MSTSINRGQQKLTWDYKSPAKGESFNRLLFSLIKPGIYKGVNVSVASANKVNITPGHIFLNCIFESQNTRTTLVEFQTTIVDLEVPQSISGQNELLYAIFEYKQEIDNYVGFGNVTVLGTPPTNSVILAELVYDGFGNITSILTDKRDYGFFDYSSGYTIPDINTKFSNYLDKTKKFKFNASNLTPGQTRTISLPDRDYSVGTIPDWVSGTSYLTQEVVVYDKIIYRSTVDHISSSIFSTDLTNWENLTAIENEEKIRIYNNTGSTLNQFRVVKISGDYTTELIPEVSYISSYSDEPLGIVVSNISTGTVGELIQRGRLSVNIDFSTGVVGQKVYSNQTGNLTLTVTPLVVGQLITPSISNSIIYVGILPSEEGINSISFNGQLSVSENTIQKSFDRLDDYGYCPSWNSGLDYRVGNSVVQNGNIYQCIVNHTSSVFNSEINNWLLITDNTAIKYDDRTNLISTDSSIAVSGGTNSVVSPVSLSLVKNNLTVESQNFSITGGTDSVLEQIHIKFSNNPIFNSVTSSSENISTATVTNLNVANLNVDFLTVSTSGVLENVNISDVGHVRFTAASGVGGLFKSISGESIVILSNVTGLNLTIVNLSGGSNLDNQILTGTGSDLILSNNSSVGLIYDTISLKWRVVGGTGSGATVNSGVGNEFEEIASEKISSINLTSVDTNTTLYTVPSGKYPKNIKIMCVNRNSSSVKIRVAHIDGNLASVASEDYIFYDAILLPNETKEILIPGAVPTDTFLIRSNAVNVNFIMFCNLLTTNHGIGRLSAFDIDGVTNLINTNYSVFTTTGSQIANFNYLICNRSSISSALIDVCAVDSNINVGTSTSPASDTYLLTNQVLVENETIAQNTVMNFGNSKSLTLKSDISNVNIIVYGKKI